MRCRAAAAGRGDGCARPSELGLHGRENRVSSNLLSTNSYGVLWSSQMSPGAFNFSRPASTSSTMPAATACTSPCMSSLSSAFNNVIDSVASGDIATGDAEFIDNIANIILQQHQKQQQTRLW